jgi:hypothetical protein
MSRAFSPDLRDRVVARVPHGRWHTLTFLAALRWDRIEAPCVIDGPINGRARTIETTWRGIGELLDAFTPAECAAYSGNTGSASA